MEWKEVRLESILALPSRNGLTKPSKIRGKGVKMIGMGELFANPIIYDIPMDRVPVTDKELFNSRIMPGDLLLARQSLTLEGAGKCCYVKEVKEETVFESHLIRIRIDKTKADAEFIYYFFNSFIGKCLIQNLVTQVAAAGIRGSELVKLEITIPKELEDQRRIASILSSLDRKIELNNKINADLEEMAQAIFKNWFVDFEPFKDGKFVDSELGMIPEGWKVVVFDNILKVTTTKTGKEGIPEYSVTNTGIHPRDEKFTKNLSKSSAKNKLIRKGNLVFGMSREILNWGIMKEEVGGVSSAYNVYIVDEKIVNTTYLECFIAQRMDYFADLIKPASREGQGVDKALLMKKIICIPPSEVMDVFLEKYNSIKLLTEIRNQESSRLSLLRDTLLPRLMSGEIEVPQ